MTRSQRLVILGVVTSAVLVFVVVAMYLHDAERPRQERASMTGDLVESVKKVRAYSESEWVAYLRSLEFDAGGYGTHKAVLGKKNGVEVLIWLHTQHGPLKKVWVKVKSLSETGDSQTYAQTLEAMESVLPGYARRLQSLTKHEWQSMMLMGKTYPVDSMGYEVGGRDMRILYIAETSP